MSTLPTKTVTVLGSKMSYLESGTGETVLFLHGIPASSYLWRNIIPHLSNLSHCIAPDLIGFGKSDKPDIEYSIADHIRYIDAFIETLGLKNITIVMHGWGSVIGCHYAVQHAKNCKGLVFYEPFLHDDEEKSLAYVEQLTLLHQQTHDNKKFGNNDVIETLLQRLTMRQLSKTDLDYYREPFQNEKAIKPVLQYIKELPSGKGNSQAEKLIKEYTEALTRSKIPKLMLYSVPGFITTMAMVMWAKEHIPNLEVVDIGEELHFGQESYADLIGQTISAWLQAAEQVKI